MSRARNIKPGFFKNDRLAECGPLTRILFAALWCEADREGRLEDRPKRIKAECLPYDDCNVDVMLDELAARDFIVRYTNGKDRFIQVLAFNKHQNPHIREPASLIPAPVEHSASTVLSTEEAETGPEKGDVKPTESPEPARLFPLSPSLIPEREPASDDASPAKLLADGKRKRKPSAKGELTFDEWFAAIPDGEDVIRDDDPICDDFDALNIPLDWRGLAWAAFAQKYRDQPKRYADWRAVYRRAVREDWIKVWRALPDGALVLTTVGEQLRRKLAA